MNHDEIRETLGAYALGAVSTREAEAVRAALANDAGLRAEYAELHDAVDAVGRSATATIADFDELAAARLKQRLLERVPSERRNGAVTTPPAFAKRVRRAWLPYAVAAAAVVVAAGSYAQTSSLQLQVAAGHAALDRARAAAVVAAQRDRDQIAYAQSERRSVEAILSEHARHFPTKHGDVISTQGRLYLALRQLRGLAKDRVYQAWTLAPGRPPIPGKTFVPQGDVTIVALGAPAAGVYGVALTVEPKGGSKKPTSAPTFVRKLD